MDLNKEAQEWLREKYGMTLSPGAAISFDTDVFAKLLDAWANFILSKQPPAPGLSVDEVMDAMDHVGHMPDNSDHSYLWEEKFRARLNELAENKR